VPSATNAPFIGRAESSPSWHLYLDQRPSREGLHAALNDLRLVESMRGYKAPALRDGASEHPGPSDCFGTGINRGFRLRRVLGRGWHEAPLQQIEVALTGLGVTADNHRGLRRSDVRGVFQCSGREVAWPEQPGST
jgi:hypothetical protein